MASGTPTLSGRVRRLRLPIRARRIELVLPSVGQVGRLKELLSDPAIVRGALHVPRRYRRRDGLALVRRAHRYRRKGEGLSLLIVRRVDRELLGGVALHHLDTSRDCAELGYWVGRPYRRQGYAAEAVTVLLRVAFHHLRLHRIEARVFPGNRRSIRLLEGSGFRFEGRTRDEVRKDGRWRSTLLYSRLVTDRTHPRPARPS